MRIRGGEKRGAKIEAPVGTRPITDMIKQALFNILIHNDLIKWGKSVDLFAGSGSIGLEYLSRGGESCIFVDNSEDAITILKKNIRKVGYEKKSAVIRADALEFVQEYPMIESIECIFVDPPFEYSTQKLELLLSSIPREILIVLRVKKSRLKSEILSKSTIYVQRNYGISDIFIFRK